MLCSNSPIKQDINLYFVAMYMQLFGTIIEEPKLDYQLATYLAIS